MKKPKPDNDSKPKPKIEKPKRKDKSPKQKAEESAKVKSEIKQDPISVKADVPPAANTKPAVKTQPKKEPVIETKKSSIDSILDDWLKGSEEDANDDTIPDELPEIDDAIDNKDKKPDMKALKTNKINTVLSDMGQISNIIDKDSNNRVKNAIDDWFSGGSDLEGKSEEVNTTPCKQEKPVVAKKEENAVPCGDCAICGKIAKAICTGCKHVFYCTRDHQRKHWSSHKDECKSMAKIPYRVSRKQYLDSFDNQNMHLLKVERSDIMGRFLIATKDLEEGELILNESPMVVGPRQLTKPVCLGCHKEITSTTPFIQ